MKVKVEKRNTLRWYSVFLSTPSAHRTPIFLRRISAQTPIYIHRMDPVTAFGVAASVVQIAELAVNIIDNLSRFYRSVRDAKEQSRNLRQELDTLVDLLAEAQEMIERTQTLKVRQSIQNEIKGMHLWLHKLDKRTKQNKTCGIRRLSWPFQQEENAKIIDRIERFKGTLAAILSIRQTYLLNITPISLS
jgi:hypothetical protein